MLITLHPNPTSTASERKRKRQSQSHQVTKNDLYLHQVTTDFTIQREKKSKVQHVKDTILIIAMHCKTLLKTSYAMPMHMYKNSLDRAKFFLLSYTSSTSQGIPPILKHCFLNTQILVAEIQRPNDLHGTSTQLDALTHDNALADTVNRVCFTASSSLE